MRRLVWLVLPVLLLGCAPTPSATRGGGTTTAAASPKPKRTAAALPKDATLIMGRISAPAGIVAAGAGNIVGNAGGNIVAAGAGNMVAAGGLNLVAPGGYDLAPTRRLLGLSQVPLAGTEVFLADAAGDPYPGIAPVKTNGSGQFEFKAVPKGYTYMVIARCKTAGGKPARLQTLAKAGDLGATANVDVGSTLVTTAMVAGAAGGLGDLDVDKLKRAVILTATHLDAKHLPDLADPVAVLAVMRGLEASVAELRATLDDLRRAVGELKASVTELDGKIATLAEQVPIVSPLVPDSQALATAKLPIVIDGEVEVKLYLRALEDARPLPADIQLRVDLVTPDYPPAAPEQRVSAGSDGPITVRLGRDSRQTIVYTVVLYDAELGATPIVADLYVDPTGQVDVDNEHYIPYSLSLTPPAPSATPSPDPALGAGT